MTVVKLVEPTNDETIQTLEWMLAQAKRDSKFNFCGAIRDGSGQERPVFTGVYRSDAAKALMAAMKVSKHLMMIHDGLYGPP